MGFIIIVFFIMAFFAIYLYSFYLQLYFRNKENLFKDEINTTPKSLTVLIPAWNEEKTIAKTIRAVQNTNFPKDLLKIIVLDDGSTDKTAEIAKTFKNIKVISKPNSGKADTLNYGIRLAKSEFTAVIDADSAPEKDSFLKLMKCFEDPTVGAATAAIYIENQEKFITKLQNIEYTIIAWARKLLSYPNCIYVTPGPLSMYQTKVLKEIKGFDKNILTEDIEIAWRVLKHNYKIKMCLSAKVYTVVPEKFKEWWHQRLRWDIGGIQSVIKHKHTIFRPKYGMLGMFVAPFFLMTFILSLVSFFIFAYLILSRLANFTLLTFHTLSANAFLQRFLNINFIPSIVLIFGVGLFFTYLFYLTKGLKIMEKKYSGISQKSIIAFYIIFYLSLYPLVFMHAIYRISTKNLIKW